MHSDTSFATAAHRSPQAGALDSHTINQSAPQALARQMEQLLAGPPEAAAATLKAAAQGGVVQAQLVYGQWLLDGHGVVPDAPQAYKWFRHASREGEPMALNMLGQCHAHGWGVTVSLVMAAYWFRLAALGGLDWGMYNYATALSLGLGTDIDRDAAITWFRQAAALGHAKSMNMIGSFYEDGWVVAQSSQDALVWYRQAAQAGDFRGQFNLARLLMAKGQTPAALQWLARVPETATPAFIRQAIIWLQDHFPDLPLPQSLAAAATATLAAPSSC